MVVGRLFPLGFGNFSGGERTVKLREGKLIASLIANSTQVFRHFCFDKVLGDEDD